MSSIPPPPSLLRFNSSYVSVRMRRSLRADVRRFKLSATTRASLERCVQIFSGSLSIAPAFSCIRDRYSRQSCPRPTESWQRKASLGKSPTTRRTCRGFRLGTTPPHFSAVLVVSQNFTPSIQRRLNQQEQQAKRTHYSTLHELSLE